MTATGWRVAGVPRKANQQIAWNLFCVVLFFALINDGDWWTDKRTTNVKFLMKLEKNAGNVNRENRSPKCINENREDCADGRKENLFKLWLKDRTGALSCSFLTPNRRQDHCLRTKFRICHDSNKIFDIEKISCKNCSKVAPVVKSIISLFTRRIVQRFLFVPVIQNIYALGRCKDNKTWNEECEGTTTVVLLHSLFFRGLVLIFIKLTF